MKHTLQLTTLFLLVAPVVASAQLAQYDAGTAGNPPVAPDPASGGWTLVYPTGNGVTLTDVSPDGTTGLNAWQVDDQGTSNGDRAHYEMLFTPQENADAATNGWEYEVVMRVLSGANLDLIFEYATGTSSSDDRYSVFYTVVGNDVIANLWQSGITYVCAGAMDGNYHTFMYHKPGGALDAEFYYDGTLLGPLLRGAANGNSPNGGVTWGTGSSGATAGANFNFAEFRVLGSAGIQYCPGDGIVPHTQCPCVNNNDGSMGGCNWSVAFPSGGVLDATGDADYSNPNVMLVATAIENNFGIFFGAANQVNGGNGNPLNDGLRCAGGGLVRLTAPTMATGNTASHGPIETSDPAAAPGVTRRYQYWFRTPGGPCGQMANLTNGYEISWM